MDATAPKRSPYKVPLIVGASVVAVALAAFVTYDLISTMPNPEQDARESCERQVTAQAKYPGAVEFVQWGTMEAKNDDGSYGFSGTVEFANGFGVPVRHFFTCNITDNIFDDTVEVMEL